MVYIYNPPVMYTGKNHYYRKISEIKQKPHQFIPELGIFAPPYTDQSVYQIKAQKSITTINDRNKYPYRPLDSIARLKI